MTLALAAVTGAACSDDGGDGNGGADDPTTSTAEPGSAAVEAYCDAVTDYVAAVHDADEIGELATVGQQLSRQARDLATDASPRDRERLEDCNGRLAEALANP